jgi:hypothetical protein
MVEVVGMSYVSFAAQCLIIPSKNSLTYQYSISHYPSQQQREKEIKARHSKERKKKETKVKTIRERRTRV